MSSEKIPGGVEPRMFDELSEDQTTRGVELIKFLGEGGQNRLLVFEMLVRGADFRDMERELALEPDAQMKKRTIRRNLKKFEDRGLAAKVGRDEYEPTPPAYMLEEVITEMLESLAAVNKRAKMMTHPVVREWGEAFIERFEDADITIGRIDACEAYNERVHATTYQGDELLPEPERIKQVREITNGVVSPGGPNGYSEYHDPIVEGGLKCEFIHSPDLVDKLHRKDNWRAEAHQHQQEGASYYKLEEAISYTLTIFGGERIGIFLPQAEETMYIESEAEGAIDWGRTMFDKLKAQSDPKEYAPPE